MELSVVQKAAKTRGLNGPLGRARAVHTFLHHELQAAELMAWALLAFPDTPRAFREGLVRIALDEIRHMGLYRDDLERRGHHYGEFAVRDWFWERIPEAATPAAFVAAMGLGVESANLDHTAIYAQRFREAGDEDGARLQELIGKDEIAHVRFGARWFEHFVGDLTFERWASTLTPPLSPVLMRGKVLTRDARLQAGQSARFLDDLERWQPTNPLETRVL